MYCAVHQPRGPRMRKEVRVFPWIKIVSYCLYMLAGSLVYRSVDGKPCQFLYYIVNVHLFYGYICTYCRCVGTIDNHQIPKVQTSKCRKFRLEVSKDMSLCTMFVFVYNVDFVYKVLP